MWKVRLYPAKIVFESLSSSEEEKTHVLFLHILGPVTPFTIVQDLERGWIRMFGMGKAGYFSYRIQPLEGHISLFMEQLPEEGLFLIFQEKVEHLHKKETFYIPTHVKPFPSKSFEKIHFGCAKKQDWTLIKRRLDLQEILPIWFALAAYFPKDAVDINEGTSHYLNVCIEWANKRDRVQIGPALIDLFKVGFEGLLCPRLFDTEYQGHVVDHPLPTHVSPLAILIQGAQLIRNLLIQSEKETIEILPCLPKEIHAGRFINIDCGGGLVIDLEWSKKCVRRLILRPKQDQTRSFLFQNGLCAFRFRKGLRGRGTFVRIGTPLHLKKEHVYSLDRFQK